MGITVGIDVGGSTTKIIGIKERKLLSTFKVKATDPLTSAFGAFGRFVSENKLALSDIDSIKVTGVGSSYINSDIYNIKTIKADEFVCTGLGGLFLSELNKAIIASMGTGTALVMADGTKITHIGGTGIGGGTLLGLSRIMLNMNNFENIIEVAQDGDLSNIDLTIKDISKDISSSLPDYATASNFGKLSDLASKSDVALGIINMIFQTIGVISVFATKIEGVKDVVLCGNLTIVPQAKEVFKNLEKIFDVRFHIPEHAEYATALGAALEVPKS